MQTDPKKRPNIEDVYDNVNELKYKIPNIFKMNDMFKNCKNLEKIYLKSDLNFNLLKSQLKKDNINAQIIIK